MQLHFVVYWHMYFGRFADFLRIWQLDGFALWQEFVLGDCRKDSPTLRRVRSVFEESEIFGFGSKQILTVFGNLCFEIGS